MKTAADVVFCEEAHTYTLDGVALPSVTTILARLYDFSFVNDAVLQAKADLGRAVHLCCELDDADDLDEASVAPAVQPYLDGYRLFKQHKCTTVIATEQVVYSPLGYAGKYDLLTEFEGERWLIDWKTPLVINPAVALQTAGYVLALPRAQATPARKIRRGALQLKEDGRYRLHEFKDPADAPTFVSFLNTYRWIQRNHP
jgi:hypothetical protein